MTSAAPSTVAESAALRWLRGDASDRARFTDMVLRSNSTGAYVAGSAVGLVCLLSAWWYGPAQLALFAVGGLIWAPYLPTAMALFQRSTTTADLPQVLAANGAVTVIAVPVGTMLGGPLVGAVGARHTILLCAVAITALGVLAAALAVRHRTDAADGPQRAAGRTVASRP